MAIILTDNFGLNAKKFLDNRVGVASIAELKTLSNQAKTNGTLPEGFEVCCSGKWYFYSESNPNSSTTGYFALRTAEQDSSIAELESELEALSTQVENDKKNIDHMFGVHYSTTLNELTTSGHWVSPGVDEYRPAGIVVSVTGSPDSSANGIWYLADPENWNTSVDSASSGWVKLISRGDIIKLASEVSSATGKNVYSVPLANSLFTRKGNDETVTGDWIFTKKITARNDISVGGKVDVVGIVTATGGLKTTGNLEVSGTSSLSGKITAGNGIELTSGSLSLPSKSTGISSGSKSLISVDSNGNSTANFDHIKATTSEILDLGDHILEYVKEIGVNNYLLNTSFCGDYTATQFDSSGSISPSTSVYSDAGKYWSGITNDMIVSDTNSMSGYSVTLRGDSTVLSQTVGDFFENGESYIVSWKQKGSMIVEFNSLGPVSKSTTGQNYETFHEKLVFSSASGREFRISGTGNVCEIKIERGTIPTGWCPSSLDTDPVAKIFNTYRYLKTVFPEYKSGANNGVALRDKVLSGSRNASDVLTILAGLNGTYVDPKTPFLWSGGTLDKAVSLLAILSENENYFGTISDSVAATLSKSIIPYNSGPILVDALIRGKFWGRYIDKFNAGISSRSDHGVDGIIAVAGIDDGDPYYFLKFKNGYITGMTRQNADTIFDLAPNSGASTKYKVKQNIVETLSFEGVPDSSWSTLTLSMADDDWDIVPNYYYSNEVGFTNLTRNYFPRFIFTFDGGSTSSDDIYLSIINDNDDPNSSFRSDLYVRSGTRYVVGDDFANSNMFSDVDMCVISKEYGSSVKITVECRGRFYTLNPQISLLYGNGLTVLVSPDSRTTSGGSGSGYAGKIRETTDYKSYLTTTSLSGTQQTVTTVVGTGYRYGILTTAWKVAEGVDRWVWIEVQVEDIPSSATVTEVTTMPSAGEEEIGWTYVKYTGQTTAYYTNGSYYQSQPDVNNSNKCIHDTGGLTGIVHSYILPEYGSRMHKEVWLCFVKGRLLKISDSYNDAMSASFTY